MTIEVIMKSLEKVEANLATMSEKADGELKSLGKVTADTKAALDSIGTQQRELADRLTQLEQKGVLRPEGEKTVDGWGHQFTKSESYKAFQSGATQKARIEVKNTLTGSNVNVAPDRLPGIVPGATAILTIESLYSHIPTTSNAIEYTKEASFTNAAGETAEGAAKPESSLTWSLVNMPVSTVAHWIKISRQLAMDNVALAAYVEARMRYGVQRKVETQLVAGDGVAPNISGFMDAGNFTAHGYVNADLGSTLKKLVLIRKIIADLEVAGYEPDAMVLNPADWAQIEIDLLTSTSNAVRVSYSAAGQPMLWGVPVVKSVGMTADTFAVGNFRQHGNIYDREGVVVQMSESDSDNFTKNLITLRAERRLALTSEIPAAIRAGDLTPA
jgi:HK97 family phage major capsid protein